MPQSCRPLFVWRSEEHTSELQSLAYLVCRLLLEKKGNRQQPPGDDVAAAPAGHSVHTSPASTLVLNTIVYRLPLSARRHPVATTVLPFLKDTTPPKFSPFFLHDALPL